MFNIPQKSILYRSPNNNNSDNFGFIKKYLK